MRRIIVLFCLLSGYAWADTTTVVIPTIDNITNKVAAGLDKLIAGTGMAAEKAFPYAIKYYGAQVTVDFCFWLFFLIVSCVLLYFAIRQGKKYDWNVSCRGGRFIPLFIIFGIIVLTLVLTSDIPKNFFVYHGAPEAYTVNELIKLVR